MVRVFQWMAEEPPVYNMQSPIFTSDRACATQLDHTDPLKHFRQQFLIPEREGLPQVYFLGNSLGLQPKTTATAIQQVLTKWADYGVEGFFEGKDPWLHFHDHLVNPLASLVGALPSEIVVMNQLTVNLHLMMASFYQPVGLRKKILVEPHAFPSDQYMLETHLKYLGLDPNEIIVEVTPLAGREWVDDEAVLQTIQLHADELALVLIGGVQYYTGQLFNIPSITTTAQAAGAKVGFDLAHAAGNVYLQLHDWNVDFACWCNYKYLNAGPGAVAACYIHERYHQDPTLKRLSGWWGYKKETRFLMQPGFDPMTSAQGWQLSTPPIILLATLRASLEIFEQAGFPAMLEKMKLLSAYLFYLLTEIQQSNANSFFEIITPANPSHRGAQISLLMKKDGKKIFQSLKEQGFWVDWREPEVIRLAAVPLYNTFDEIWQFASAFKKAGQMLK